MRISYECQDLINELAQDIFEFGDFDIGTKKSVNANGFYKIERV